MQLSLSRNISLLRRQHGMTQEQLAQSMGVTFASVSKWERGAATPDLTLIARMADLFGVSLDALVGFTMHANGAAECEVRIHALQKQKNYDEGICEAEKALLRYPNDFSVVYRAGTLYSVAGIETGNEKWMYRCIELLEHAITLLSQNADPQIGEVSIQTEIAQCYIVLGQTQKGIELLKKHNVGGLHNALIAISMIGGDAQPRYDIDDAVPYMVGAFVQTITTCQRMMLAYIQYFYKKGDIRAARDAALWLIGFNESVKRDKNLPSYVDKISAPCYSECANFSLKLGEEEKVEPYLRRAYETAKRFDAAPTAKLDNLRFCIGSWQNATAYDDLGESATAAVVKQITQSDRDKRLHEIWQRIACEEGENT